MAKKIICVVRLSESDKSFLREKQGVTMSERIRELINKERGLPEIGYVKYKEIKNPDNNCFFCGSWKGISIHHLDKNPQNNSKNNLIFLCGSCHTKLHSLYSKIISGNKYPSNV